MTVIPGIEDGSDVRSIAFTGYEAGSIAAALMVAMDNLKSLYVISLMTGNGPAVEYAREEMQTTQEMIARIRSAYTDEEWDKIAALGIKRAETALV